MVAIPAVGWWPHTAGSELPSGAGSPSGRTPPPGMSWDDFQETQETLLPGKPLNVKALQRHLRSEGYKIPLTGKMGPLTKSALADYLKLGKNSNMGAAMAKALKGTVITGKRNPKAWNQRFGTGRNTQRVERPLTGPGGQLTGAGNLGPVPPTGVVTLAAPGAGAGPAYAPLRPGQVPQGAQMFDPGFADQMAAAYDPMISNLQRNREAALRAAEMNAQETRGWYDQVVGSLGKAAGRDKQINSAARESMTDATQAILSSLGGVANEGAGVVGAAGTEAVGTIAALGSAQEQYNEDLAPLLQGEGAGMATRVRSQGSKNAAELASRLAEAQGQRGGARAEAMLQIAQMNNDIRNGRADRSMQLRQYNDQLAQQGFNNQMTMAQAQLAALGLDAQLRGGGRSPAATSYPYAKAPQSTRVGATNQATDAIQGMSYPEALQTVNQILRGYGWSLKNPAVLSLRNQILAEAGIKVDPRTQ